MNNLGAALLQKQKQSLNNSTIDLAAIQHKFNVEIQQLIATINALKGENDALKSEIDGLKGENDTLKAENDAYIRKNVFLEEEYRKLVEENVKLKNKGPCNIDFVFLK